MLSSRDAEFPRRKHGSWRREKAGIRRRQGEGQGGRGERRRLRADFTPRREEDEEAANGGANTAAAPGSRAKNPATLLEKGGTIRCVSTPD
ncbi:hypothetical protein NDU88_002734 [Pleurodeles waltl]|uniref:Uncharacterized protein n=1 Tax=Pleurodeles waltl TaxID=8319 RepID=A0AAV7SEH5_PLEWA|nr:hypothetical protein NDU88_002734 [Pleurodeles waltl]